MSLSTINFINQKMFRMQQPSSFTNTPFHTINIQTLLTFTIQKRLHLRINSVFCVTNNAAFQ